MLTSATLSAANIGYATQETLFQRGAPELAGLVRLGSVGLGSATVIAENIVSAIELVEEEVLKPLLRELVKDMVPIAVLVDESTARTDGRRSWVQLHVFASTMSEPMPFDAFIQHKSGSGVNVADSVRKSLTREGFLTAAEFAAFVKVGATDHAASVLKACEALGLTAVGDPPHAVELVVKKIVRGVGLRPLLMALRKIFTRKTSTAHQRLLSGFGIATTLFQMYVRCGGESLRERRIERVGMRLRMCASTLTIPVPIIPCRSTTRWCYWTNMLASLSKADVMARLQQLLAYMIKQHGDEGAGDALVDDDVDAEVDLRDAWDEGDGGDMPDPNEEGISPAVRTQRKQKVLSLLQSAVKTLTDPNFHSKIIALAIVLRPLKYVNVYLQYATPDPATLTTLNTVYATLNAVLDRERREPLLERAKAPLTAALSPQPLSLTLTAVVTRNETSGETNVTMQSATPVYAQIRAVAAVAAVKAKAASGGQPAIKPVAEVKALTASENADAMWAAVLTTVADAVNAGVTTYNKRVRPVVEFAERRHIASLYQTSKVYLDGVDFAAHLADAGALPFVPEGGDLPRRPWTWVRRRAAEAADVAAAGGAATSAAAAAAAACDDDDSHLDAALKPALKLQWVAFKLAVVAATSDDPRTVTLEDRESPARYWIRTRAFWPDLSELMLLWLTTPISTACVERGFSFLTMMDSNARRRRTKEPGFRAEFLAHLHRDWLRSQLRAVTA